MDHKRYRFDQRRELSLPHYVQVSPGDSLPDLSSFAPFKAIVIVEELVSNTWRNQISVALVRSGCRFMMAWGRDCALWDDSVDWANIEQFKFGRIPESAFVMTTWHDDESLANVFRFAKRGAMHDAVNLSTTVILHIALEDKAQEFTAEYELA